jgi:uncharacterized protein
MRNSEYYIEKLNMEPHVEGGYFKETFLSEDIDNNEKNLYSSIYFLLRTGEVSNFHRLKEDELWYFHAGESLTIYMIDEKGNLITKKLGLNIEDGEEPQVLVKKGCIFGSAMNEEGYALVGCMVAPAFSYNSFELFEREDLLKSYPEHKEVILKLTRE